MAIRSYEDLVKAVQERGVKPRLAVIEAQDAHAMEAVVEAKGKGLIEPVLIGNKNEIERILDSMGEDLSLYEIQSTKNMEESLTCAVTMIHENKADILMKGKLQTKDLMKMIVSKENGLRTGDLISLLGVFEIPGYHKLLSISDMGINTYPDLPKKEGILKNAVNCLHSMGMENPKVAILSSSENYNPKFPDAVDAVELKKKNENGEINGCIIEGPISLDLAMDKEAVEIKGYESPVAADADLLIVPDIVSGNLLSKALLLYGGAQTAGLVLGAKVPVVLTSRSATAKDKFNSIALAAFASGKEN